MSPAENFRGFGKEMKELFGDVSVQAVSVAADFVFGMAVGDDRERVREMVDEMTRELLKLFL